MSGEVAFDGPGVTVWHGDCIEVMRGLPEGSVHAVVTDPPYGINMFGQAWDGAAITQRARRGRETSPMPQGVGGPRGGYRSDATEAGRYDRSPRASRAFQEWCAEWAAEALRVLRPGGHMIAFGSDRMVHRLIAGVEDAGFEIRGQVYWAQAEGFPKSVDISRVIDDHLGVERTQEVRKKKVPDGSGGSIHFGRLTTGKTKHKVHAEFMPASPEAKTWEGWGTALKPSVEPAVMARKPLDGTLASNTLTHGVGGLNIDGTRLPKSSHREERVHEKGRWPANLMLDGAAAEELDRQAGEPVHFMFPVVWSPKAQTKERPIVDGVEHPTVKPLGLMRRLVRLVCPPGGTVMDPFAGSGTTLQAALEEGMQVIGVEREEAYLPLIESRLRRPMTPALDLGVI